MEDKQAYVEDYNSVLSEVVPVPRRAPAAKRQSGLSQCMNASYEGGSGVQSDSGYSSHSAEQQRHGQELEDDRRTPTDHTPPPVPAHHRRQISQLNSVMNSTPQMPTPTNSRPGSNKNLSRSNSPAVRDSREQRGPPPPPQQQQQRQQRPESPTDSDDESDCDCANCRGSEVHRTPSSPLSTPWSMNYPPFNNGPHPGPPGPPGPPMLSGSFPKNYGQPGFPPMGAPYGRYETSPPYGRPPQGQLLPPISLDEEAIEEESDVPPRRPDSTRRDKPRPMSYSGSTSQNPVSSHGSWGAYGSGYPTPGGPLPPGSQPPPPSNYPPSQYQNPSMNGASGSPQGQPSVPYGYPPGPSPYPYSAPPPQGYPPYSGAEMVPWGYSGPPPPGPSSDYGAPPPGPMPPLSSHPSHLPLNRRYSMRSGELPPPRDYASMDSPQQPLPPMPNGPPGPMNRRSSQRGGQPPYQPHMHQDYGRSISVPPVGYGEPGAPVQDGRRRVTTPQPLLSGRTRRDSNTSASVASSRLPPIPASRYADTGSTPGLPHTYTDNSQGTEPPTRASPHPPSSHQSQQPQTPHHQNPNRLSGHFRRSPSVSSQHDPNYGALVPRNHGLVSLYNDNESAITTDYDIPEESEDAEHYAIVPVPPDSRGGNFRMYYSADTPIRLQLHGQPGPAQRIQFSGHPHMRGQSIELTVTYRYVDNSEKRRIEEEDERAELEGTGRGMPRMIEDARGRRSVDPGHREYVLGEE